MKNKPVTCNYLFLRISIKTIADIEEFHTGTVSTYMPFIGGVKTLIQ